MDAEVEEDGEAVFSCELNHADEEVQWLLNDTKLCSNEVNTIQQVGKLHTLTLKNLPPEDSGTISVTVRNKKETASLKVKGKTGCLQYLYLLYVHVESDFKNN